MTQQFKEFNLIDLFSEGKISRGLRITKNDRLQGDIALVTAGKENHGIAEYIKSHKAMSEGECLTIDMFGNCFYRNIKFFYDDNIIMLKNNKFNKRAYLYINSMLNYLPSKHGYSKQFRYKDLNNTYISLPITSEGELDFEYMENYIKEIEQKYVQNLREGLDEKINNLLELTQKTEDDISDENIQALKERMRLEYSQKEFKEFKVGELFTPILNTFRGTTKLGVGKFPLVCGSGINNGRDGYGNSGELFNNEITMSTRGSSGSTFYQDGKFILNNNAMVLKSKIGNNKYVLLYIVALFNKLGYSGYDNYPTKSGIVEDVLNLPINSDGDIDYDFMERYVKSLEAVHTHTLLEYMKKKELG